MCSVCGLLDSGPQWSDPMNQNRPQRQLRQQQLAQLNAVLKPYRLKLTTFHNSWQLASPTGQRKLVANLDQLWAEAEKFMRGHIDPLDESWLNALNRDR